MRMVSGRRRMMVVLGIVASTAAFTGCAAGTDYGDVGVVAGSAVLHPDIEEIDFPIERYDLTLQEDRTIRYATMLLEADCTAAAGYPHDVPDMRAIPDTYPDRSFGRWSMLLASKWGYGAAPPSDEYQRAMSLGADVSAEEGAVWERCIGSVMKEWALDAEFVYETNALTARARNEAIDQARAAEAWAEAVRSWSECVQAAGLVPDPDADLLVSGAEQLSGADGIRAAVSDATCKEDGDVVQRLAVLTGDVDQT